VIEDRSDIIYEVRDATDFQPSSGLKPWVEELPPAGAVNWAARSSRRKQKEKYRLAFVPSKFRIGQEPEPFVLELNLTSEPWTVADVTDDVDREGAEARKQRAEAHAEAIREASDALAAEIQRRASAGEPDILKKRAEEFLAKQHFTQKIAREALDSPRFEVGNGIGKGRPKPVRVEAENNMSNRNPAIADPARTQAGNETDFGGPVSMRPTEIHASQALEKSGSTKGAISVDRSIFSPPESAKREPQDGLENAGDWLAEDDTDGRSEESVPTGSKKKPFEEGDL